MVRPLRRGRAGLCGGRVPSLRSKAARDELQRERRRPALSQKHRRGHRLHLLQERDVLFFTGFEIVHRNREIASRRQSSDLELTILIGCPAATNRVGVGQRSESAANSTATKSRVALPASVTLPVTSVTRCVRTTLRPSTRSPREKSTAVSVMSRPFCCTAFRNQPFGRSSTRISRYRKARRSRTSSRR